jgi:antibiotic biosynthesis monooxygenase (ABM) superfamily enzyme
MEHEGRALAADETDAHHHRNPGVASIHVRATITWLVIFPLAALGMSVLARLAPAWPPVLRAFVLTATVVPTAVYFAVPRLLLLYARVSQAVSRRRT